MKYVYFIGAALCGLLAVCSILSMTGIADFGLDLKDAVIGFLGVAVGIYLGLQVVKDENRDGPMSGRLR